jgi:hypothetical protein
MSDGFESPEIPVGFCDHAANRDRTNAGGSLRCGCGRRRGDRRTRGHPFADRGDLFRWKLALRRHFDASFVAESLQQEALIRLGRLAEKSTGGGFFDAVHRTEVEPAALEFLVMAALTRFDE